jgi:UDP-glucose 4-epimerase
MKAIITGGAGFIGSHVAKFLLQEAHEIMIIDNLSGAHKENIPDNCQFVQASINDNIEKLFIDFAPDIVYHLAAYAAEGLSHHIPMFNYTNNILGTINVLNAAYKAKCKHFVFTSSIAVYGHPNSNQLFDENTNCEPCDPYGTAKLACELHIKSFVSYYNTMNFTIFRPHNVFGPNQNISDPYRNVVGIFMAKALQQLPMPVFGDGLQTRSFSYINIVAQCIAASPFIKDATNQVFNIGSDEQMNVKMLAKSISNIFNVPLNIEWLPERKEVTHAHCNHDKAKKVFSSFYTNNVLIEEGLKLMAESVLNKPIPAITECPSAIEIYDLLPPSWSSRLKNGF